MNEQQYEMHMVNRMQISRSSTNLLTLYSDHLKYSYIQIWTRKGYLFSNTSSGVVLSLLDEFSSSKLGMFLCKGKATIT